MLKLCFKCGEKSKKIFSNGCEKCQSKTKDIFEIYKIPNFKICNYTKEIFYKNYFYKQDEIKDMLVNIVKKNIKLKDDYKLKNIDINDFEIEGHKLKYNLQIDYDLK